MYTLYHFSSITPTGVFYHLLRHCLHQLSSTRVPTRALSRTLAPRSCTVVSTSELQRRKPCVVNAACRHSSLACQAFSVHMGLVQNWDSCKQELAIECKSLFRGANELTHGRIRMIRSFAFRQ